MKTKENGFCGGLILKSLYELWFNLIGDLFTRRQVIQVRKILRTVAKQ